MDNITSKDWLDRAYSNLLRGKDKTYKQCNEIFLEDLCYDLQQSVEKSLKALLIHYNIEFPKTHDITVLLKLIKSSIKIDIPQEIYQATALTIYAVLTRYPNWNKVTETEYEETVKIADSVYKWVKAQIIQQD